MKLRGRLQGIARKPRKGRAFIVFASAVFTLATVLLYLYQPAFIRSLDSKYYDTQARALLGTEPAVAAALGPVVVDLDEESLARYGQWPWPRYRVARLVEELYRLGAASIGLDILLTEPDRTSFATLRREIQRDMKLDIALDGIPKSLLDNDKTLAEALARGPSVLGYRFTFGAPPPSADCLRQPPSLTVIKDAGAPDADSILPRAQGVLCSLGILADRAAAEGFVNAIPDPDGVLRRVPLLIAYDGKVYPSLALATLTRALGIRQISLKIARGGIESLRLGKTVIPLDSGGHLLVRYRGKGRAADRISAAAVLAGDVSRERIQGKILFLGTSAAGLADIHPVPVDPLFPGIGVHATVVDNILKGDFISRPHWVPGLELSLVLGAGLFSTFLLARTGALWSMTLLLLGAIALWQGSGWALRAGGIFFSPITPLIALVSHYSFVTILKYWREERKAKARSKNLILTQEFTIRCLASLTETRDSETGGHILRTQRYVSALSRQLASNPRFEGRLDAETIDQLFKSAPLHDIGKVGVPDHILLKPGKLTTEEFEQMKKHTTYGRDAIQRAEEDYGRQANSDFLNLAKEIAYTHHEKWDGTGYPEKLKGEEIPLSGRLMALADVYDALVSHRVYKPPFSHAEAVALIVGMRELLFDPEVVDAFLLVQEEFRKIAQEIADHEERSAVPPAAPATSPS